MPDTANRLLTYPDSSAHTRIWEHIQELANDVDRELDAQREAMVRRINLTTWTLANPANSVIPNATERTALTANFTKARAATRLIVRMHHDMLTTAGVEQTVLIALKIGATIVPVGQALTPPASGRTARVAISGQAAVSGIAAGTFSCEPVFSAGAIQWEHTAGGCTSWSIRETL